MYRFVRTVAVKTASQMQAAMQFCGEMNTYLTRTHDVKISGGAEMFARNRVSWFIDANSLEDFAKLNAKLAQDPAYWEILKKGSPLWVEGSMKDRIVSLM